MAQIDLVPSASQRLGASSQQSLEVSEEVTQSVRRAIASMASILEMLQVTAHHVSQFEEEQPQIGAIVQTINETAEQTNLLALNTAIEAARAGDQGRGFAVVADEVRKLAEHSSEATTHIADLIEDVRAYMAHSTASMAETTHELAEGFRHTDSAKASFKAILEESRQSREVVNETETAVKAMHANASKVSDMVSHVAAMSKQSVAAAEELSATSEQTATATTEVTVTVEGQVTDIHIVTVTATSLENLAQDLWKLVNSFDYESIDDLPEKVEVFIGAHRKWVERVEAMVGGEPLIPLNELVSHKDCKLGQWYKEGGRKLAGSWPEFPAIDPPHARLHAIARKAVEAMRSGNQVAAQDSLRRMRQASEEVIGALEALRSGAVSPQVRAAA